jgi:hypothetical protein
VQGEGSLAGKGWLLETNISPAGYLAPLRRALIDDDRRHVNVVMCETDYRTLKEASRFAAAGAVTRTINT